MRTTEPARRLAIFAALLFAACQSMAGEGAPPEPWSGGLATDDSPGSMLSDELPATAEAAVPDRPVLPPAGPSVAPRLAGDELHSLELRDLSLARAVQLLATAAGVNLILDVDLDQRIDVSFPSTTLDDALQLLLARHGLHLVEEPPGLFWVRRDP